MRELTLVAAFLSEMRISSTPLSGIIDSVSQFPDLGLRTILFGADAPFHESLPFTDEEATKIWMVQDPYHCRYVMAYHPEEKQRWLVGPYTTEDMSLTDITRLYQRRGLPHADMNALRQYYLSLPKVRDESIFDALINAHCLTSYGTQGYEIGYWKMETDSTPPLVEANDDVSAHAKRSMEERYAIERQMMDYIAQGNYYGAAASIAKLSMRNIDSRTGSTLRDRKNYTIVFNTLCRVAAERGCVAPIDIDRCSNLFALEIESAGSVAEARTIRERMLKEYCDLVRSGMPRKYSSLVSSAIDILDTDFSEAISLSSIAGELCVTPNYLSSLFKKETGTSFTDFLTNKRLEHAKSLLTQTDQSVGEIAFACGIHDQNYFSRLFKAKENCTPIQFRNKRS